MYQQSPPVKPPRGVKHVKETSALLMSVIRTLSASENNEQRDREKAKLETEYKFCDRKLDELVSTHEEDLTKVMHLFSMVSQIVSDNRTKIAKVKEDLQDCKKKLHCRRDELKNLWLEGLEYRNMLQLLEEIEKIKDIPGKLSTYMSRKQYLHATKLLIEAVTLGKGSLEGVESLKGLSRQLEQKKEHLHVELLQELRQLLYFKPAQQVITLRRQESGRDFFIRNSSSKNRLESDKKRSVNNGSRSTNNVDDIEGDILDVEEDLNVANPEENSVHFIAILTKCLFLLDKLPFALDQIKTEMQTSLLNVVQKTTQYIRDFSSLQRDLDSKQSLIEFIQTLFDQFIAIAETHGVFLKNVAKLANGTGANYDLKAYWMQVQYVLQNVLSDYLDMQNMLAESQIVSTTDISDLSSFFSRRKQQNSKKSLFKLQGSSSALTLSNNFKPTGEDKTLICKPHPNNILVLFIPFMIFIEHIEKQLEVKRGTSHLYNFLTNNVSEIYLKRKSDEIISQIEAVVNVTEAWKATLLIDTTADYKPLLHSTISVDKCIREWIQVFEALPLYSEKIAHYSIKALKEYRDTCLAAYQGIVQPHPEERRICSAAWLKDEDISRFLKSLPNWVNLKSQQRLFTVKPERTKRNLERSQPSEEESPEDVRIRNKREAEILASNLGEGGIDAGDILSDMNILKELAQLQESMEWFAVRMFQYISEFRQTPQRGALNFDNEKINCATPVPLETMQELTKIAQEFDELANTCLLLLHLEVRVQCFHYLLSQNHCNRETHEPDPKVLELSRVLANVDEAMTSSLHPRKCKYIFEGLGHLVAKILISSAQYFNTIDEGGIQRMCRNIFALQQTLTNITMTREVALDQARHYFELFFVTPEEILNRIVEEGPKFSELEYMNAFQLLTRSRPGLDSTSSLYLERLSDILGEVAATV